MCVPCFIHFFYLHGFSCTRYIQYFTFSWVVRHLSITSERTYIVLTDFIAVFNSKNLKVLFWKLVNMAPEGQSRIKSNKEQWDNIGFIRENLMVYISDL